MGNRARLCIALAVAIAIGHGTPAGADDWGYSNDDGNGPVQVPDSLDHAYCFDASVPSSRRPVYTGSMAYLDDTTAFSDVAVSCSSITDVAFYEADLGSGIRGYSPCQKWVTWGVCDRTNVYVNAAEIFRNTGACGGGQPRFDVNLITTIRHEIGHTVGLHHIPAVGALCGPPAGDDAMTSDFTPVSLDWVDYNAHHVAHMNCRCD